MRPRLFVYAFCLFAFAFGLAGCARRGPANFSAPLLQWLEKQQYSTWELSWESGKPEPRRPDGLTLGNRQIFAGIGCTDHDVSQIEPLYGDRKSLRAISSAIEFSLEQDGRTIALKDFGNQRLRRIARTSIAVADFASEDDPITMIDFAPLKPELNCLVRFITIQNRGDKTDLALHFSGRFGDFEKQDDNTIIAGGKLAIYSNYPLETIGEDSQELAIRFGKLGRNESRSAAIFFIPSKNAQTLQAELDKAKEAMKDPVGLLNATSDEWRAWRKQVKVDADSQRLNDLIDGLLCMIKSHVGFDAIHTGSLRYPHTRAWVRDNYWVQRALLEAGLKDEAKLNLDFFFAAWKKSGLCSYYEIANKQGQAYGDIHVELPHYFVLMVKDAEKLGGLDGKPYWPMVKGCLDMAHVGENGLQPINGDETWLLAAGIDQLDYVLDNSLLLIASAEYGADLAKRMGDQDAAEKYGAMAQTARLAMETWLITNRLYGRLAVSCSGGEAQQRWMDEFPASGVSARPIIFGIASVKDSSKGAGLLEAWGNLSYSEGIRAYSRSHVVDGGTPGYFLYAASEAKLGISHTLVQRVMEGFCSATGNVWELQSVIDPKWGLEKRRLWDSAVLLMGLMRYSKVQQSLPAAPNENFYDGPKEFSQSELSRILGGSWMGFDNQFVILEKDSASHARELATQLARHFGKPQQIGKWIGQLPPLGNFIIISSFAPSGFRDGDLGLFQEFQQNYAVKHDELPGQFGKRRAIIWVKNTGNVFADLRGLEYDLFRSAVPLRKPAAFPDSDIELAKQISEEPKGWLESKVSCDQPISVSFGNQKLQTKSAKFALEVGSSSADQKANLQVSATTADRLVTLAVSANGGPQALAKLEVAFPAGYWVVEARGIGSNWDRTADPIDEIHRPDGSRVFVYQVHLVPGVAKSFSFKLARPAILAQN